MGSSFAEAAVVESGPGSNSGLGSRPDSGLDFLEI